MAHSWIYSLFFSFTKILLSAYAAQPGSSMATRRSSRTSPTNSRKPNGCFIFEKMRHPAKQKGTFSQKENLSLPAEATINAAAKDRIYVIFFWNTRIVISSLMSLIVTIFAINHLLTATAVVFPKLLQWSTLRTLPPILFYCSNLRIPMDQYVRNNKLAHMLMSLS